MSNPLAVQAGGFGTQKGKKWKVTMSGSYAAGVPIDKSAHNVPSVSRCFKRRKPKKKRGRMGWEAVNPAPVAARHSAVPLRIRPLRMAVRASGEWRHFPTAWRDEITSDTLDGGKDARNFLAREEARGGWVHSTSDVPL